MSNTTTKADKPADEITASALAEVDSVHDSLTVLSSRLQEIRSARAKIADEVQELRSRPLSRADVLAFALAWVDECAAHYKARAGLAAVVDKFVSPQRQQHHPERDRLCIEHIDNLSGKAADALPLIGSDNLDFFYSSHNVGATSFPRLYFFFGDAIKARISEAFAARFNGLPDELPIEAEPLTSRRAKLAELAGRDDQLGAEEGGINSRLIALKSAIRRVDMAA